MTDVNEYCPCGEVLPAYSLRDLLDIRQLVLCPRCVNDYEDDSRITSCCQCGEELIPAKIFGGELPFRSR